MRFTSPHPADFTDDVITAMAETPNVMPQLHMPLQSGSDRMLKAMRRSYRRERYLGILDRVRAAMPDAAITTDIIVGFPGETEDDFVQTLEVVAAARFAGAFTFQYSQRPGTPAATLPDQVPADVVQERYERLVELVNDIAWDENSGSSAGPSSCWSPRGRVARTRPPTGCPGAGPTTGWCTSTRPGDRASAPATWSPSRSPGAPHHLVADGGVLAVRRTRSGDAWEARTASPSAPVVGLGMPTVGAPVCDRLAVPRVEGFEPGIEGRVRPSAGCFGGLL